MAIRDALTLYLAPDVLGQRNSNALHCTRAFSLSKCVIDLRDLQRIKKLMISDRGSAFFEEID